VPKTRIGFYQQKAEKFSEKKKKTKHFSIDFIERKTCRPPISFVHGAQSNLMPFHISARTLPPLLPIPIRRQIVGFFNNVGFRVARWFVYKPKIPIRVNFGGPLNGKCCNISRPFGIFYGHLVLSIAVWYSLWSFVTFFPIWYFWTKENMATLVELRTKTEFDEFGVEFEVFEKIGTHAINCQ
jgi:hypothetical protein